MQIEELACPRCGAPYQGDFAPNQKLQCGSCHFTFVATGLPPVETVTCPKCKTISSPEQRFCADCGQPLQVDCILCHTANPVTTVYCTHCGAHLQRAMARRKRIEEKKRRHQGDRQQRLKEKAERQKEERLQRLLDDLDEPENHDFAIYQINQLGVDAIAALTETLLTDSDPDARYGSARALGQICSEQQIKGLIKAKAAKALIKALSDSEAAVRFWSAGSLGKCKSKTAIEPLAGLLQDPHAGVRRQAHRALQQIGGKRVQNILADVNKPKGLIDWIKKSYD